MINLNTLLIVILMGIFFSISAHAKSTIVPVDSLKGVVVNSSGENLTIFSNGNEVMELSPLFGYNGQVYTWQQAKALIPSLGAKKIIVNNSGYWKYAYNFTGISLGVASQLENITLVLKSSSVDWSKAHFSEHEIIFGNGMILSFSDLLQNHNIIISKKSRSLTLFNVSNAYDPLSQSLFLDPTVQSACGTISSSGEYELNQSVTSTGTCISITASDVSLNCLGYSIFYDSGGTGGDGVTVGAVRNVTVKNCNIQDVNSSGNDGYGIQVNGAWLGSIANNTIQTNGTSDNQGIRLQTSANNNTIIDNVIRTQGTGSDNYGVYLFSIVSGNVVQNNSIVTNGTTANMGVRIETSSSNNQVLNNTIQTRGSSGNNHGIYVVGSSRNNTIINNNVHTYGVNSNVGISISNTASNNTIRGNTVQTNGASGNNGIQMDASADGNIIINNTIMTNGTSVNLGIIADTSSSNSIVQNTIRTQGTSGSNTGIGLQDSANNNTVANNTVHTQGTLNGNVGISLVNTVSGSIITNNTVITNGTIQNYGIRVQRSANNTITNNVIHTRGTGSDNYGMYLSINVSNTTIRWNKIMTNGTNTNIGIQLESSANDNTIADNTIGTNGTTSNNDGIHLFNTILRNRISNNTITTNGTNNNVGIRIATSAINNTIMNNTIRTQGTTTSNHGVYIVTNSSDNIVEANTIESNGSATTYGIRIESSSTNSVRNQFRYNTITTDGKVGNNGVSVTAENNTFIGNVITAALPLAFGIELVGANYTVFQNTVIANLSTWINPGTGITNFSNTSFETLYGRIRIFSLFNLTNQKNVNQTSLNTTLNRSFLNSTDLTELNVSAQISLYNITLTNPRPVIDLNDDGLFATCYTPDCIEVSYILGQFTFNVSHFTSYSADETRLPLFVLNMSIWPNGTNMHLNESVDVVINVTYREDDVHSGNMTALWFINNSNNFNQTISNVDNNGTYQFNLSNTTFGRNATIYVNITGFSNISAQGDTVTSQNVTVRNIPPNTAFNFSVANMTRARQNITLGWNATDFENDQLRYNVTFNGTVRCGAYNLTTSCTVYDLSDGTYNYSILAHDGENYTETQNITVVVDDTDPQILNLSNVSIEMTKVIINWTSDEPINFSIRYGADCANLDLNVNGTSFNTSGSVFLINMVPGTEYCWRATFFDNVTSQFGANSNISDLYRFRTQGEISIHARGAGGAAIVSALIVNATQNVTIQPSTITQPPQEMLVEDGTIMTFIKKIPSNLDKINFAIAILATLAIGGMKLYYMKKGNSPLLEEYEDA